MPLAACRSRLSRPDGANPLARYPLRLSGRLRAFWGLCKNKTALRRGRTMSDRYPSRQALANKIDWEGGLMESLDYGIKKDGDALFLQCNAWRQMAENCAESLQRGMRVIVQGRLRQRSYETKEGEKRTVYEVEVDEVGPSLRNGSR